MSDELSPEARSILDAARSGDDPTEADRARVRAALLLSIGVAGGAGAAASASATTGGWATSAWKGWALAKLLAALTLTGAVVGVISIEVSGSEGPRLVEHATGAGSPAREIGDVAASLSNSNAPSLVSPSASPEPLTAGGGGARGSGAPRAPSSAASSAIRTSASAGPSAPASTLEDETKRLRAAHAAMQSGDPEKAITLLDEQSNAYANGVLRQERAAARVLALCQAGRVAEASAEAARFLLENPTSPLADRVRASCASPRAP